LRDRIFSPLTKNNKCTLSRRLLFCLKSNPFIPLILVLTTPIFVVPIDFFGDWAFNVFGSTRIDGLRGLDQYKYQSNPFIPLIPVLFACSTKGA
jgi:hypothetical protein